MSRPRFDSAHMLPLFRIIAPNIETNMNGNEQVDIHHKHKRKSKRPEVPVHVHSSNVVDQATNSEIPIRKTSRTKSKHKHERVSFENDESTNIQKPKIKRKHLLKENERILSQNEKLIEQLQYVQTVLDKKDSQILKLKEKYASVQNINKEIIDENNIIKTQYEDVVVNVEEFKTKMKNLKCSTCEELQIMLKNQNKNYETAKSANNELNEDLNMLKNVIYRLNVQLERYQQKLKPNALMTSSNNTLNLSPLQIEVEQEHQRNEMLSQQIDAELAQQHSDHLHTPISWGDVNSHTLGPLLDAYQDTIKEKEDIIKKYEFELVTFTDKLKRVVEENDILHRKCVEDSDILEKNIVELEANRKELKVTKDQNDLLIKKCALKHDKLQEICKVYDHKIECIKRDYEVLQDQYHNTRVEFSSLQGKYQSLVEANDSLKSDKQSVIPLSVHTTSVNECKRLFEELKIQYENEKSKYVNQIKLLEDQAKALETKVIDIGTEKRDLIIKIKSAEKQLKKLETKLSESHNSLTHTQISRDACKRQLSKAIEFGKELVTEQESLLQQLSSRHKENKAVKQIGCSIVNRMDILKSQLKTVQKDAYQQLASVEQRIHEQDSSMESMRRDHENEIGKLLQQIHDKDKYIAKLIDQTSTLPPAPYLLYREKHMHVT